MQELRKFWPEAQDFPPLPKEYESWSASQKQELLWDNRILKSQYAQLPPLKKIDVLGLLFTILRIKMDDLSDQAPPNWKKAIHAHGSVAKIKFVPTANTPFTGLFKGADFGFLRVSLTGDPTDRGFAPGLAIKFFVDGKPSENFSALVSLTGQDKNYNFFANEFSNIVPVVNSFGPKFINWIFSRVTKYPTKIYLQGLGQTDQRGNKEISPYYPYQIFLVPNPYIKFPESPPHDFRNDMANIAPATSLFSVYAVDPGQTGDDLASREVKTIDQPEYRQKAQLIGNIQTTSDFVSSFYGDSLLFFRHQRFANK